MFYVLNQFLCIFLYIFFSITELNNKKKGEYESVLVCDMNIIDIDDCINLLYPAIRVKT